MTERKDTRLKAALFDLVSVCNMDRSDDVMSKAEDDLTRAIHDLVALRTWKATALPLLRALLPVAIWQRCYGEGDFYCSCCLVDLPQAHHTTDCPVTLAKALLAESETNNDA